MLTHLAARTYFVFKSFVIISSLLGCFFYGAKTPARADECPPLGLGSYSDYFVGTTLTQRGGVRECGFGA